MDVNEKISPLMPQARKYETLIVQKLDSKFSSPAEIFLHLDIDNDGLISRFDLKDSITNMFGIELDDIQMEHIFKRFESFGYKKDMVGIKYGGFIKYLLHMINECPIESEYGSGDGLHLASGETIMHLAKEDLRSKVKEKFLSRTNSFKESKAVHLFLQMAEGQSDNITLKEFQNWLETNGLVISHEECEKMLGSHIHKDRISFKDFVQFLDKLDNEEGFCSNLNKNSQPKEDIKVSENDKKSDLEPKSIFTDVNPEGYNAKAKNQTMKIDEKDEEAIKKLKEIFDGEIVLANEIFQRIDKDNAHSLDANKLYDCFKMHGINISMDHILHIIDKYDEDGKGNLTFSQFLKLLISRID